MEIIGEEAFSDNEAITSVVIPNGVKKIEDYTFAFCSKLTSVEIPISVVELGQSVFSEGGLREITYRGTKADRNAIEKDENWFGYLSEEVCTVHCTDGDIVVRNNWR